MTDRWHELPAAVRTALVARGLDAWQQVYDGVATHNKEWRPLRSPIMSAVAYRRFTDISATVARLILSACLQRASTAGSCGRRSACRPVTSTCSTRISR